MSVPATHKDGSRLSIEFSVALLRDEAGEIVGISAIMREVSERREAEKALRTKLAELQGPCGAGLTSPARQRHSMRNTRTESV